MSGTLRPIGSAGALAGCGRDASTTVPDTFRPNTSIMLTIRTASGGLAWPTVNNLMLANAMDTNVMPEPSTWMWIVTGFGMLVLIATHNRSRRR